MYIEERERKREKEREGERGRYQDSISTRLLRQDKYQKKLIEYWVDVETTGSRETEMNEGFKEKVFGEAAAPEELQLGGFTAGPMVDPESEDDDDDDDDDDRSCKKRGKRSGHDDLKREHALEATL